MRSSSAVHIILTMGTFPIERPSKRSRFEASSTACRSIKQEKGEEREINDEADLTQEKEEGGLKSLISSKR